MAFWMNIPTGGCVSCAKPVPRANKAQLNELWRLPRKRRGELVAMEREIVQIVADALAELNPRLVSTEGLVKPVAMSLFSYLSWHCIWFLQDAPLNRHDYGTQSLRPVCYSIAPTALP